MKAKSKGRSLEIAFDSTKKDQTGVVHLFDALLGREPTPTCEACGGTLGKKGPTRAHCDCPTEAP